MKNSHIQFSYAFSGTNRAGEIVHPVTMRNRKTGEVGFRVTPPTKGNTLADALIVSEAEMIVLVRDHGCQVRCSPVEGVAASLFSSSSLTFNPLYSQKST